MSVILWREELQSLWLDAIRHVNGKKSITLYANGPGFLFLGLDQIGFMGNVRMINP